ncbi:molybdenum cofactor guanylyltransferase [Arcobacter sp. CECT 8983]|uniref:molybdenum cofactor guanylyltransferase MobA n=1 Tax=Arcobacter sp. CECT 8983 TaxID=2044508 RepID=UPI00100BBF42|nr:molybdenum cofactor guanylyltransferase MobA [Arcobacter sp. CECT 8983]RXJ91822.1 molybdenum cofactor guanylyltransferase [Arcobacter sp. CECT 8983]
MNRTPLKDIPCVILCGGKSSRMGEDKSLLPFSTSSTLTQYQYEKLKKLFENVYLSSKVDKFDFISKEELLLDEAKIYSPIAALQSIFSKLNFDKIFIITVDTPLVKLESIKEIIKESNNYDITVAKTDRVHNLCGIFKKHKLQPLVNKMLKEDFHKVGFLLKELKTNYVEFLDDDEFINLNEKDEYQRALEIISKTNDIY